MNALQIYEKWLSAQPMLPIFLQPWWMEAVCANKHWEVNVWETDGKVTAAMPYLLRKRMGMRFIVMPQLTQLGGVWTVADAKPEDVAEALDEYIQSLHLSYYYQQFPIGSPIPQLLSGKEYIVRERITYRIEDCSDVEKTVAAYNRNKQRQLKKSSVFTMQQDSLSAKELYRFHQYALAEQKKTISYPESLLCQLFAAVKQHRQGTIVALYDEQQKEKVLAAAAFYVWDNDAVHYLIAAQHPCYQHSGLMARLVTEGIRIANRLHLAFDFEGSMIPGVAKHFQQFGATPAVYYSVERYLNPVFWIFYSVYQWFTRKKR